MKKIYLFLIVLFFSTSSKAVCPTPPGYQPGHCQIPKGALENGEIVYKETYCKGDFPYCDNWTGDCCSETGYATENGGVCCHDPNKYVKHLVGMINPGGVSLSVNTYKCCDVATYGKKSTYYFDKEGHVQCCGGAVYQEKTGGDKNCCNPEFDEGGNVTRYHTVVDVKGGLSEGRVEKLCCEAKGEGKGEYRQTGYWDGNFVQCCDGKPYKMREDEEGGEIYGCCIGSKGRKENRTHTVVEKAVGAPNGEGACCEIEKYGEKPTAYWNGSSVQCCKGTAYTKVIDGVTYGVCCSEEIYGSNPSVYWNDKTGICCKNAFTDVQNRTDGAPEKVCCDHDIYGTSAEAYGSGTCCVSYERVEGKDVCCMGKDEKPTKLNEYDVDWENISSKPVYKPVSFRMECCVSSGTDVPMDNEAWFTPKDLCCKGGTPYYHYAGRPAGYIGYYSCFSCPSPQIVEEVHYYGNGITETRYSCCPNGQAETETYCWSWDYSEKLDCNDCNEDNCAEKVTLAPCL